MQAQTRVRKNYKVKGGIGEKKEEREREGECSDYGRGAKNLEKVGKIETGPIWSKVRNDVNPLLVLRVKPG